MAEKKTKSYYNAKRDLRVVRNLILEGMTQKQVAQQLGISPCTFSHWKKRYPELAETVRNAIMERDELGIKPIPESSEYDPKLHPELLKALMSENFTVKEIANRLGISFQTFYVWRHRHKEFDEAYKQGIARQNGNVERSLLKLATGFKYKDGEGRTRVVLPDFRAVKFYLINRVPERWQPEAAFVKNGQGTDTGEWDPSNYTMQELRDIIDGKLSE